MYDIDVFRSRCDNLLNDAIGKGNKEYIDKLQRIKDFLSVDNCFFGARKIFVSFVLENLGYSADEIKKIYNYFNGYEMIEGILEYVDESGELIQFETLVNPKIESYYKFVKGPIFKYNTVENDYYLLYDNKWIYDGGLQRKIDDLGSDYISIDCVLKEDSLRRR